MTFARTKYLRHLAAAAVTLTLGVAALALPATTTPVASAATAAPAVTAAHHPAAAAAVPHVAQHPYRAVCGRPSGPAKAVCMSRVRTDVTPHKGLFRRGVTAQAAPSGYGPADLQSAYGLPSSTAGSGATVAIVDAFDDPGAEADLATYRSQFGLPPCTTASGCFAKVNQEGQQGSYPPADSGWAEEESLDVDMVSAACPACKILLVEGNSSSVDDLGASVDEAVALGAKYVSNSYGTVGEDPAETSFDHYYDHPGVAVTASGGDAGFSANYPAVSPFVTSVGGTSLLRDAGTPRGWAETVWGSASGGQGTGSGCSLVEPQPSWQAGVTSGCANRATDDISAVADPDTGVAVYDSGVGGWAVFGGTSVGSPLIAAAYALAGQPAAGTYPAQYLYDNYHGNPAQFNDVTAGADGTCDPSVLCTAGPGWDGPTGLGTPAGVDALASPAGIGSVTGTVTDSATGNPVPGAAVSAPGLSVTAGSDGSYTLGGLPAGSYQVSVSAYGYQDTTATVTVTAGQAARQDFALTGSPHQAVSGTVTAGTGTPWPLYAQVSWTDGSGHSGTAYTAPATGKYTLSLLQNTDYTLTVTVKYPGYENPAATTVTVGTGDVSQDFTAKADLVACTAIGYHPVTSGGSTQTFDTNRVPQGWSVTTASLGIPGYSAKAGWAFDDPGGRGNQTGGTGGFAIVDSDHAGQFSYQDTQLISPALNLSADTTPAVQFATDLRPWVNQTATVDLSTDGGKTWSNAWTSKGYPGDQGPATVAVPLPAAAGKDNVRVRFGYTGQWSQWWAVDNVFIGDRSCQQQDGGLLTGRVDDGSGTGINGATVASITDPDQSATTTATPGDNTINGGLYALFVTGTGSQQFTASATGYAAVTQSATITAGQATTANFTLAPAQNG